MAIDGVFGQSEKNILVAGHRGIRAYYPENTMLSFQKAIDMGVDMIEMDINLSSDKVPMVIHDHKVDRTTNGKGFVHDMTCKELQALDAGVRFNGVYPGCKIPTFDEFLDLVSKVENFFLNVEIKEMTHEAVDLTVKMLEEFKMLDKCVIACFDASILRYAFRTYGVKTQGFPESYMQNYDGHTSECFYSVGIHLGDLKPETCRSYVEQGIDPWGWCPDTDEDVYQCIRAGATLITCNNPEPALRILRQQGLHR